MQLALLILWKTNSHSLCGALFECNISQIEAVKIIHDKVLIHQAEAEVYSILVQEYNCKTTGIQSKHNL